MRRFLWYVTLVVVAAVGIFAFFIQAASPPAPLAQEVLGVALVEAAQPSERVHISGKRLTCAPVVDGGVPFRTRCAVELLDETLTIWATRNGSESHQMFGGRCAASYGAEALPCEIGSRHVHVHWFAYVEMPTALGAAEVAQLQRRYVLENLPESFFVGLIWASGVITAVLAVAHLLAWLRPQSWQRVALSLLGGLPVAAVSFYSGILAMLWLTGSFFD